MADIQKLEAKMEKIKENMEKRIGDLVYELERTKLKLQMAELDKRRYEEMLWDRDLQIELLSIRCDGDGFDKQDV